MPAVPDPSRPPDQRPEHIAAFVDCRKGRRHPAVVGHACPRCGSDALYRYGRTAGGHPRFLCKVCRRQFSVKSDDRLRHLERPCCAMCGRSMHIYQRTPHVVRFRCAGYPECRSFRALRLDAAS